MNLLTLTVRRVPQRLIEPFRISGYLFEAMPAVIATIADGEHEGRGEAAGVYYLGDDSEHMETEIERQRAAIEAGIDREELRRLLPPGGARNAIDCALWEFESRRSGRPVWQLAGVAQPQPLVTTFTLSAEDPAVLVSRLDRFAGAKAIKLKLDGDFAADRERVRAVRRTRPDVWLGVDANQGYTAEGLDALAAMLVESRVSLLEQPLARGKEACLDGWRSPIPVAADESFQGLSDLDSLVGRFQVVNIKLDKCGGLTEALMIVEKARRLGLTVMVGNMAGSSLSAAPGFVLGQLCDIVDLDGPLFLADDAVGVSLYRDGRVFCPETLWGAGSGQ